MSALTDNIDKLIEKRGVGRYKFYKEVGISAAAYSQWKSGAYSPRMERIQTIADYLGVSVSTLLETQKAATPKDDGLTDAHLQLMSEIPNLSPAECHFLLQKAKDLIEFRQFRDAD